LASSLQCMAALSHSDLLSGWLKAANVIEATIKPLANTKIEATAFITPAREMLSQTQCDMVLFTSDYCLQKNPSPPSLVPQEKGSSMELRLALPIAQAMPPDRVRLTSPKAGWPCPTSWGKLALRPWG